MCIDWHHETRFRIRRWQRTAEPWKRVERPCGVQCCLHAVIRRVLQILTTYGKYLKSYGWWSKIRVPFLGTLHIRCRTILRTQKGTIILTTTHIAVFTLRRQKESWAFWGRGAALGAKVWDFTTRVQEP